MNDRDGVSVQIKHPSDAQGIPLVPEAPPLKPNLIEKEAREGVPLI